MANENNMINNMSPLSQLLPQYKVEGFDPNAALTKVVDVDYQGQQTESLFMKYMPSMAWFLTVFPDGCMNYMVNTIDAKKATITASIFRHTNDTRPAAMATCTRYYDESPSGRYYVQNAVTAAYRKALGYLGFGTPLDAHEVEGIPVEMGENIPERTDMGVVLGPVAPPAFPAEPQKVEQKATEAPAMPPQKPVTRRGRKPKAKVAPVQEEPVMVEDMDIPIAETKPVVPAVANTAEPETPVMEKIPEPETAAVENMPAPEPPAADFSSALDDFNQMTLPEPEAPTPAPELAKMLDEQDKHSEKEPAQEPAKEPVKEPKAPLTLEEALKVRITLGKMRGKTIEEAAASEGKAFIRWHCDKARMQEPNSPLAEALQLYCEYYGC